MMRRRSGPPGAPTCSDSINNTRLRFWRWSAQDRPYPLQCPAAAGRSKCRPREVHVDGAAGRTPGPCHRPPSPLNHTGERRGIETTSKVNWPPPCGVTINRPLTNGARSRRPKRGNPTRSDPWRGSSETRATPVTAAAEAGPCISKPSPPRPSGPASTARRGFLVLPTGDWRASSAESDRAAPSQSRADPVGVDSSMSSSD
jgi:hypothetical protein